MYPRPMNDQAAFDNAWDWFIVKGNPRAMASAEKSNSTMCVYYDSESNKKCAIGCQLPLNLYYVNMEGTSIDEACKNYTPIKVYFEHCSLNFLTDLQSTHDEASQDSLEEMLLNLADDYGLRIPD